MPDTIVSDEITSATTEGAASSSAHPSDTQPDPAAATREPSARTEDTRIPLADHERILDRYHREVDALAWARGYDPDEVRDALAAHRRTRDRQPEAPQPDLQTEDGRRLYSADQAAALVQHEVRLALAEHARQMDERFGPIESGMRLSSLEAQIDAAADWPGFTEAIDDITAIVQEANRRGQRLSLAQAYIMAGVPQRVASATDKDKQKWLADEKKKWLAELNDTNTRVKDDVNPNRTAGSTRKSYRDMDTVDVVREVRKELASKRTA